MEPSKQLSESIAGEQSSSQPWLHRHCHRMPSFGFGIKTVSCVILLAMGSGDILRNALNLDEQHLSSIHAVQHNFSASQASPQGNVLARTKDEEQLLATDEEQMITHKNATSFLAKEASSSIKVAKYQFPSVQERLQYYMGDWYNKSDWTVPDSDCKVLRNVTDYLDAHDVDIILHTTDFKECTDRHARKGIAKYCRDTYDIINNTLDEADGNNNRWIVSFGDRTQGIKETLPIITKARPSALSLAPQPIVWLLNKRRHYKDLEYYHRDIVKKGKEVPWSEKLSKVFWRGATTRGRLDYLAQWINYDDNHTDIKIVQKETDFKREYVKKQYVREKQSLLEMNRYKYLLSIEGNDVVQPD